MRKVSAVTDTADVNGEFTEGNVAQGVPPTILKADIFNTWQRELVNVVEGAGIILNPESDNQVYLAIKKLTEEGGFLSKSSNLSDVESSEESRANLQIYSKLESDSKFSNINGNQNVDFYVRDSGDATAAVNNARLNSTLQGMHGEEGMHLVVLPCPEVRIPIAQLLITSSNLATMEMEHGLNCPEVGSGAGIT